ncbi:MAG: translation termination inhibitor protein itt1 [Candelina mexicana]|nr:MAG: translation termination inhibitor protein itt1 [Candelina mexicana]
MADDSADPEDEREIELSSIAAIFPELVIDPTDPFAASIDLPITPREPLAVFFPPLSDGGPPSGLITPPSSVTVSDGESARKSAGKQPLVQSLPEEVHYLSHLPPLTLQVTLPNGYPADNPPKVKLFAVPSWLPDTALRSLKDEVNRLWEEYGRDQVLYYIIDHLQQAAERGFDLVHDKSRALEVSQDLKIELLDFDVKTKRAIFEKETFECGVCLEPKKGAFCHRLVQCSHVFCVACLQDFYNSCIAEGDVTQVKCLSPNCGPENTLAQPDIPGATKRKRKHDRTLNPSELLQIPLEHSVVKRYVDMKRKKKLESDKTTIYCPRKWCQGAARSKKHPKPADINDFSDPEEDSGDEKPDNTEVAPNTSPPAERIAICEDCDYAFCRVCKAGWHGEFATCWPRKQAELTAEERASEEYMSRHTTRCPSCSSRCQKTHGCNHMRCFQCNSHFCYLCSAWLDEGNPYQHFNNPHLSCYMRLWELEEGDGVDVQPRAHDIPLELHEPPAPPRAAAPPMGMRNAHNPDGRGAPNAGLERFLLLVENDEEDEWDSDEMDDPGEWEDENGRVWEIPVR